MSSAILSILFSIHFFKDFIYLFLGSGEGREKVRERNINVWLPLVYHLLGTWPTTQACALTGNWTGDPLVHRPALNHWATPARAGFINFCYQYLILNLNCISKMLSIFSNMVQILNDYSIQIIESEHLVFFMDSNMKMCRNFPTLIQMKICIIP